MNYSTSRKLKVKLLLQGECVVLGVSVIQSDHLSRRDLEFLINTCLQILIQEGLQLFVLLVEQASFFN